MNELNERAALNHQLRLDAEAVERRAEKAKARRFVRAINKAHRRSVTIVAVDAALVASIVTAGAALLACCIVF